MAALFVVVIGHTVTIGFHRLFTHRSFVAKRPLKISLAVLGTMSFQGSLIGWVADHRRHHRFSERAGDPHSPWVPGRRGQLVDVRGFWHAHIGWCFSNRPTSRTEYAPDLLADPDLVFIDKLFIPCCIATLALPFAIGYALYGTMAGAVGVLIWAGILRVGFTHNFTWMINSVCHRFGTQPFRSHDQSRNFALLAPFTMGEAWHNAHHAFPRSARHGVEPHQLDSSARLIRIFERLGWATDVKWPDPAKLAARRVSTGDLFPNKCHSGVIWTPGSTHARSVVGLAVGAAVDAQRGAADEAAVVGRERRDHRRHHIGGREPLGDDR